MSYAARFGESRLRPSLFTEAAVRVQGSGISRTVGGLPSLSMPILHKVAPILATPPQTTTTRTEKAQADGGAGQSPAQTGDSQTIL
jgi:hypothetical protein